MDPIRVGTVGLIHGFELLTQINEKAVSLLPIIEYLERLNDAVQLNIRLRHKNHSRGRVGLSQMSAKTQFEGPNKPMQRFMAYNTFFMVAPVPAVACVLLAGANWSPVSHPEAVTESTPPHEINLTLRQLQELRRTVLVERQDSQHDFNKPGLVLTYDFTIADGWKVHSVNQPDTVDAKDDAGTDLSNIERGFRGDREYIELAQSWGEPPTGLTLRLLPSSRGAETFSLNCTFTIEIFGGTEELRLRPTQQWQDIDSTLFPSDSVELRMREGGFGGSGTQVTLRPGSARDVIDSIYLVDGDKQVESMGAMWSSDSVNYTFDQSMNDNLQLRIVVRTDVKSIPLTIELEDQRLP